MRALVLILLISCAQTKKSYEISSVTLNTDDTDIVAIDRSKKNNYGPTKNNDLIEIEQNRSAVISINLYSSIYHSLAFLELIRKLEKKKINISLISSHGFGLVLAALYAKEKSASFLEWKLFDLMKRLKGKKVFSNEWVLSINKFSKKEFKNLKLNQLKILLLVPEINKQQIKLNKSDKVVDVISRAINLRNSMNFLGSPKFYNKKIERIGTDISLNISFVPNKISFRNLGGFEWGLYTRYLGLIIEKDAPVSLLRTEMNRELDRIGPLSDINKLYSKQIDDYIVQVIERLEIWQEENTTSLKN